MAALGGYWKRTISPQYAAPAGWGGQLWAGLGWHKTGAAEVSDVVPSSHPSSFPKL